MRGCIILVLLAACGYTNPGTGTKTLEVNAVVTYVTGSASTDENDKAAVALEIKKNGAGVANAEITLRDDDSHQHFSLAASGLASQGKYAGVLGGYHRRLFLQIKSGDDSLFAKLEGPGRFSMSSPDRSATLKRSHMGSSLKIRWKTHDGIEADRVVISVNQDPTKTFTANHDSGSYNLSVDALGNGIQVLDVSRENAVMLAGGAGSSYFTNIYDARNVVTINE